MNVEEVKRKYRRNAAAYDLIERATARLRATAVHKLRLCPGDAVLDFGCGTGLSFPLLEEAVGPRGRIWGVDVSPDMLARARARITGHGWTNVTLVEANAEEVPLERESVGGVLCFYTHDIMTSAVAVRAAVEALRPGGRFVAAGAKRSRGWLGLLLNPVTLAYSLPAITNVEGLDRPWNELQRLLATLEVEEHLLGTAYIARGVKGQTHEAVAGRLS